MIRGSLPKTCYRKRKLLRTARLQSRIIDAEGCTFRTTDNSNMKIAPRALIILVVLSVFSTAQSASPPKKHLLVIGEEKGYRHESVSHAMATIERLGRETGVWDTTIRTDTEILTKKKLEYNAKNLNDFDAVLFFTGGDLEMDAQQKADFLSFIHEEGKEFIGVHIAAITFVDWPEFVEMVGGTYDEHPWTTFDAPILVE